MKLFPSSRGAGGGGHSLAGEGGGPGQDVAAGGRAGGGAALAHTGRGAPLLPPQLTQQGPAHTVRSALSGQHCQVQPSYLSCSLGKSLSTALTVMSALEKQKRNTKHRHIKRSSILGVGRVLSMERL